MISLIAEILISRFITWPKSLLMFRSTKFNTTLSLLLAFLLTASGFAVTRSAPVVSPDSLIEYLAYFTFVDWLLNIFGLEKFASFFKLYL